MSAERPTDAGNGRRTVPVQRTTSVRVGEFERAYERHYRDVYRYLLGLTRSPEEADDIASETFERALRAWNRVPEPSLPWLLLTARRVATDRWRRARRLARIRLRVRSQPPTDAGERQTEFWLWFDALAAVLTHRQREVLMLRYQRDLSDEDIGSIMGISASGVRSLVARSLDVLRSHPELL